MPRLWEADLGPFGERQAAYLQDARSTSGGVWGTLVNPGTPGFTLVDPLLREVHAPVMIWAIVKGAVDALGVVLLFAVSRRVAGVVGATLAGAVLALNPSIIAASRDLAGPLTVPVVAGALLIGVLLAQGPSLVRGMVFGALLGLLARTGTSGLLVVGFGAATLALAGASWRVGGVAALTTVLLGGAVLVGGMTDAVRQVSSAWAGAASRDASDALLAGVLYRPTDGWPPGSITPPGPIMLLVGGLCLLGVAAGLARVVNLARCGQRGPLVPVLWLALCLPFLVGGAAPAGTLTGRDVAVLAATPLFAVVLAIPNTASSRYVRWGGMSVLAALLLTQAALLAVSGSVVLATAGKPGAFAALGRASPGQTGWSPLGTALSLRQWQALAVAAHDAAARAGSAEIVLLPDSPLGNEIGWLRALIPDGPASRALPVTLVLPLEREAVYLVVASPERGREAARPVELQRPASRTIVATPDGTDTGARLVTLRPRPAADWLSTSQPVPEGRFGDGSRLAGMMTEPGASGDVRVTLIWELPAAADGRSVGQRIMLSRSVTAASAPVVVEQPLPNVEQRRSGELTVVRVLMPATATDPANAPLTVSLLDGSGRPVRALAGGDLLTLPR